MQIKLNNHYFDIKITDWDPEDPEYVIWEFADEGVAALADALDLYTLPHIIAAFKKAVSEQRNDVTADHYCGNL